MHENKIPHCSWSWNNKNEPLSYLIPGCQKFSGPYNTTTDLTVTGKLLSKIVQEWSGNQIPVMPPPTPPPPTPPPPTPLTSQDIKLSEIKSKSANAKFDSTKGVLCLHGAKAWASYSLDLSTPSTTIHCSVRNPHATRSGKFRIDYEAGKKILGVLEVPPAFHDTITLTNIVIPTHKINLGIFCIDAGSYLEFSRIRIE
jgi:hypothetical protein